MKKSKRVVKKKEVSKKGNKKIEKTGQSRVLYGLIIAACSFFLTLFFIPSKAEISQLYNNLFLLYIIALTTAVPVFAGITYPNSVRANLFVKYFFLATILFGIGFSLIPVNELPKDYHILYFKLLAFQKILIVPSVSLGIVALWLNKEKLNIYIDSLYNENDITKRPNSRFLINLKEKTGNLFSKKEIAYISILFLIIGISVFTLFYRLDHFDLYSDEAQVTQGAAGYFYTGEYKHWDFVKEKTVGGGYERAMPHLFIVAQSYKLFGISCWSSRFPSALVGLLFIIISYFIIRALIKDAEVALLSAFSFSMFFYFLQLFRWSRMYAFIIPLFIIALYIGYRFITEKNRLNFLDFLNNNKAGEYFNFNYALLPLFLIVLYFSYALHTNTLLVLVILFFSTIFYFFLLQEKRFLNAFFIGIILIFIGIKVIPNVDFIPYVTAFEKNNVEIYSLMLFGFPFSVYPSIILLAIGVVLFLFSRSIGFKKIYLLLYLGIAIAWILFSFVLNYSVSFRYIGFVASMSIMLIISVFVIIIKTLYSKLIQYLGYILVLILIGAHFYSNYANLYVKNYAAPAKPSIAIKTIVDKHKKNEFIYRHWGADFYYRGIDKSVKFGELGSYQGKPFNQILDTIKKYKSGWLTWMSHNTWRMDKDLLAYTSSYFTKHHGHGIDETDVEVFSFTDSMFVDSAIFAKDKLMPNANLNLKRPLSLCFWVNLNLANKNSPFIISSEGKPYIEIKQRTVQDQILLSNHFANNSNDSVSFNILAPKTWHHVCVFQTGGNKGDEYGIFINGTKQNSNYLNSELKSLVKLKLNSAFVGQLDDIRIYDFVLSNSQLKEVINNRTNNNSEELIADGETFKTLFHWQRR